MYNFTPVSLLAHTTPSPSGDRVIQFGATKNRTTIVIEQSHRAFIQNDELSCQILVADSCTSDFDRKTKVQSPIF